MNRAATIALSLGLPLLAACSATSPPTEVEAPRAVPATVNSDADRRAIYEANSPAAPAAVRSPVPDATPNTQRLGENAADINRRQPPGTLNTNDPNNLPPETRLRQMNTAPVPNQPRP